MSRLPSAFFRCIACGGLVFAFGACSFYSFAGSIPPHIRSIAIPLFQNETTDASVAEQVTDGLTRSFLREGILRLAEEGEGESVLRGIVLDVSDSPYTFTAREEVNEYRVSLRLETEWFDAVKEAVLLKKQYTGWGAYALGSDPSRDELDNDSDGVVDAEDPDEQGDPRQIALRAAVEKIATDILSDIAGAW